MGRRVVITGIGLINACGNDAETAWRSCVEGRSGIGRITRFDAVGLEFPCLVAGEIRDFVPEAWVEAKEVKKLDLSTLYGIAAGDMAWKDAGLSGTHLHDPDRAGVIMGRQTSRHGATNDIASGLVGVKVATHAEPGGTPAQPRTASTRVRGRGPRTRQDRGPMSRIGCRRPPR